MLNELIPIFMITFTVFVLFFLFMGIGFMVKKQPLKGSCGGVANLMGDEKCSFCGDDPNQCGEIDEDEDEQATSKNETPADLGKSIM